MQVDESYRYIGVLAVAVSWLAIGFAVWRHSASRSKSISSHVSSDRKTWLIFAPLQSVGVVLFYLFGIRWLAPALALHSTFHVFWAAAALLQLVATWTPDTDGRQRQTHRRAAYSSAALMPLLSLYIASSSVLESWVRVLAFVCAVAMVITIRLFMKSEYVRDRHLVFQTIYFIVFHVSVLAPVFVLS